MQPVLPRPPIQVLEHNLAGFIESVAKQNGHALDKSVRAGTTSSYIDYFLDRALPRGPFVDNETRTICFQESYLAFLWAFIYSNFVVFELAVQKRQMDGTFTGSIDFDTPVLQRAKALGDWARRFAQAYELWDEVQLPNPRTALDADERSLGLKVNEVYLRAVSFLFFHEYGHLYLGHVLSTNDQVQVNQEKEADNFALEFLVNSASTEEQRQIAGVSIVLLCASNLFLTRKLGLVWQERHPHLHDRLRHALSGLNLETPKAKYYLYYLASINIKIFLDSRGVPTATMTEETAEDLFFTYLDEFDKLQSSVLAKSTATV